MARPKKNKPAKTARKEKVEEPKVEVTYPTSVTSQNVSDWKERITQDLRQKQAYVNLVLGLLILIVLGTLAFRFFKKPQDNLGPANTTTQTMQASPTPAAESGSYTVKEGDTLFSIAEQELKDGYQYPKILEANQLANPDAIAPGMVLKIPR